MRNQAMKPERKPLPRLIIHAVNIHTGGGAVLLDQIMQTVAHDETVRIFVDRRMHVADHIPADRVHKIKPTLLARLAAEIRLAREAGENDRVLCLGNLPPLFRLRCPVTVFLQNRYLLQRADSFNALPFKVRVRLLLERAWLKLFQENADRFFVQASSMQQLARLRLRRPVECFAFVPDYLLRANTTPAQSTAPAHDFLYVASGEAHKNHRALIEAWKILAQEGLHPSLALTLSPQDAEKCLNPAELPKDLQIINLGLLPHGRVIELYQQVRALIYPSEFESLGLPLLEASHAGLPILAAELDYVRDVAEPVETFDPRSPVSIARAVRRFLRRENSSTGLHSASDLLARIGHNIAI
jgi:glycosyltransferase involved in cell wall biosynthesis